MLPIGRAAVLDSVIINNFQELENLADFFVGRLWIFSSFVCRKVIDSENKVPNKSLRVRILGKFNWSFGFGKRQHGSLRLEAAFLPECQTRWGARLCTRWESLPQSLHLLLGRPPWWWVLRRQGSGGLPLLSACPLSPWRTWSWKSWALGDCWRRGTVVGCRAGCPLHLGAVTGESETQTNDKRLAECFWSPHLHDDEPWWRWRPRVYFLSLRESFSVSPECPCVPMSWFGGPIPPGGGTRRPLPSCLDPRPPWGKSLPGPRAPLWQDALVTSAQPAAGWAAAGDLGG